MAMVTILMLKKNTKIAITIMVIPTVIMLPFYLLNDRWETYNH